MTYRDDLEAARMRREALARELHQVRSRMDGYHELARHEQTLEREIAQCSQDIEQARTRVELPLLSNVRVASPCKERWVDMAGDDHVRFCGRCEKNVYDLSSLTASAAEALLRERGESMCVRFFRRSDGTILTSDCPVGARKRSLRRVTAAAVASGVAAAGIALAGASGDAPAGAIADAPAGATADAPMSGEMPPYEWQFGDVRAQEQQVHLTGYMGGTSANVDLLDLLNGEIEGARSRLAAATTRNERVAARQELKKLRVRARKLRHAQAKPGYEPQTAWLLRIDWQIEDARTRLAAATTGGARAAALQHLENLRARSAEYRKHLEISRLLNERPR